MLTPEMEQRLRAQADAEQCTVEALLERLFNVTPDVPASASYSADSFFELSLAPMCVTTLQGEIVRMNTAFERLFGYRMEEITYALFTSLMHPDDMAETVAAFTAMREGNPLIDFVNRYRIRSGELRWLSWTVTPHDGFIYAVVHDVTNEKQLEQQLQSQTHTLSQQVQQLEAVLDSQIDLISMHSIDTTLLFVNDAYCTYFGKTREELIGKSFMQFVPEDQHPSIWQRIEDIKRNAAPGVMITDNIDSKGQRRTIQWADHVITDDNGQVIMIQSMGRDITRLVEVESELASKEREYRLMFENNPLPMLIFDPTTLQLLEVNESATVKYGYTRAEFLAKNLLELHPADEAKRLQDIANNQGMANVGLYKNDNWRHILKNGQLIDVEINSHNIVFTGKTARLTMVIDISERKQMERERLRQQKRGLESEKERELQEQRERFFGMVSHEFKTPLSVILSSADLMRRYYDRMTQEQVMNRIDIITEQARETVEMIEEFLAVGPGKEREIHPQRELIELDTLCRTIIQNVGIADNHQHKITLEGEMIILEADAKMMRQIFNNLISNAVKYSPSGSIVRVSIAGDTDNIHISVSDEGIGIPEEEQARIFQPFIRASNARGYKGTGLGLAIVYQNVVAHGGTVDLDSRVGAGTHITVHLPRHQPMMRLQ